MAVGIWEDGAVPLRTVEGRLTQGSVADKCTVFDDPANGPPFARAVAK